MRLAVDSYVGLNPAGDLPDLLELVWTLDERKFLAIDLAAFLADELHQEAEAGLPYLSCYPVDDPYGGAALSAAVSETFGMQPGAPGLFTGAGVGPMLAALAAHARGRTACIAGSVYPDFPIWVKRAGGRLQPVNIGDRLDVLIDTMRSRESCMLYMERPQFLAAHEIPEDKLACRLAEIASAVRTPDFLIVIDESNANYAHPSYSLAPLVGTIPSLAVVRGFSKAYQLGGLRLGYCISGASSTVLLRELIPPLLASPLALRIGSALLRLGDVTASLRTRIADAKPIAMRILLDADIAYSPLAHALLPYILLPRGAEEIERLEERGIRGKLHHGWEGGDAASYYRLSVPLVPERLADLERRLSG